MYLLIFIILPFAAAATADCQEDYCNLVDCRDETEESCAEQGLVFDPRDAKNCKCCQTCATLEEVTSIRKCKSDICSRVRCAAQTMKDCKPGQVLAPYKPDYCVCCPRCVDRVTPKEYSCEKCCKRVNCWNPKPKECFKLGLAFVPRRSRKCECCDSCGETLKVTEPFECKEDMCTYAKCASQTIGNCTTNQVLVPRNPALCYCCDRCVGRV